MDPILKKLKDELAANAQQAQELAALAETEERELDESEQSVFDACVARCEELKSTAIPKREKQIEQTAKLGEYAASANTPGRMRPSRLDTSTDPEISVREGFEDDPKAGFRTPREFLTCVMEAGQNRSTDKRLAPLAAVGSDEQGVFHDAFGGFLVPESFAPGLKGRGPEADPTMGRTTMLPMSSPRVSVHARVDSSHATSVTGGLRVYRRAEADTVASSRMELERVTLNAHSLMGIAFATDEILTDSPISFAALLAAGFGDEFQSQKFREKLQGSGVGEYEGVNNTPALISVTKETGQAADTIVYENVIKMYARCWGKDGAIWLANHDCLPQLMLLNQSIGTGGVPVWQSSAREGEPSTLLGLPIFFSEHCETVGDAGDIILCNWAEYLEGELGGTSSASSIHVRFVNHEQTFRFSQRNDGRSWWRAALTPDNGSTLSPFVRLAARA
jgi:HK97 family phage major capsid protein